MADDDLQDGKDDHQDPDDLTSGAETGEKPTEEPVPGEARTAGDADAGALVGRREPGDPATASSVPVSPDDLTDAIRGAVAELPPEKRNRFIPGTLTVHYGQRDVAFPMDGESALRMLAVLAGTSNDVDEIRRSSDALRGWLMIDRNEVLGAQWTPAEATVPRRPTMDPSGLVDAV